MATTSFKTRRALGRRYATDPALLLEMERLQREYALAPGRESRALQARQFGESLEFNREQLAASTASAEAARAQQASQFNASQRLQREQMAGAETAGMVGTISNVATNAAMLRALSKPKGEPFFGGLLGGGKTPPPGEVSMSSPQAVRGAVYGEQGAEGFVPKKVNPATIDMGSTGAGFYAASGGPTGAVGTMVEGAYPISTYAPAGSSLVPTAGETFAGAGSEAAAGAAAGGETAASGFGSAATKVAPYAAYYGAAKLGGSIARNVADEGTVVHQFGESLDRPLGVEQYWADELGAPDVVQDVLDVLNPISVVEEFVSDAAGTVICTELHRQGLMSDETYKADSEFGKKQDMETIAGYHTWAIPLAIAMRNSKVVTWFVAPIAMAWAENVAGKPNTLGRLLNSVGIPICRFIGHLKYQWRYNNA